MPLTGYWWRCGDCQQDFRFRDVTNSTGAPSFIWDELRTADWDQSLLTRDCPQCGTNSLKMTYEFPRARKETLTVRRIVGLDPNEDGYMPMLWETIPETEPDKRWLDFKYQTKRNATGLNRPPVFSKASFARLISRYQEISGEELPL